MKKILIILIIFSWVTNLTAEEPNQSNFQSEIKSDIINNYIKIGLENNLALKQKRFMFEKSIYALDEARGLFYPSVSLKADYTLASGGRKIDFPVGDLLNPVYATLNVLTSSKLFPQISNVSEQLLPDNFHDTRIRTQMALYNAEINYNYKIRKESSNFQEIEIAIYKRELVKEIKSAYFKIIQANKAEMIYSEVNKLLEENKKISESLVKNNILHSSALLKIEAEISKNNANIVEMQNNQKTASAYLNYLLNQSLDSKIEIDNNLLKNTSSDQISISSKQNSNIAQREELLKLKSGLEQTNLFVDMKKSSYLPTLNTFLDLGYQGYKYKFDNQQSYVMFGLSMNWNIFNGLQDQAKISQAEVDKLTIETQLTEVEKQLELQKQQCENALNSAEFKYNSSSANIIQLRELLRITNLRFQQGQALQIEYLDALTQLTNAEINRNISWLDIQIKNAELERVNANFKF